MCYKFYKVFSVDGPTSKGLNVFPMTWKVARDWVIESQICYCEEVMNFYNQSEENTRSKLGISFDKVGTLQRVYSYQLSYYLKQLHYKNLHMIVQRERLHMIKNTIGA